ncbi:hypothetical protein M5K25_022754 [Dendrobium thyrsiflorum]|uniref:8-oxoguanine DNA glycosylase N-terminal domain-containing protein n=1 Tax=Dendrobium thyrsiflorum TaxID=117978 RepID=A0ABD0U6P9_DENTH
MIFILANEIPARPLPRSTSTILPKQFRPFCGVMSQLRRLKTPPPTTPLIFSATSLPSPHPITPPKEESNSSASFRSRTQRSLTTSLLHSAAVAGRDWQLLDVPRSELSLPLTLPTGQTFRWRRTGPSQFTGVVGPHLLSLKHADEDPSGRVHFFLHDSSDASCPRAALSDYLNLEISLTAMWRGFSAANPRFDEISRRFDGGARVLRQDPVECVFQFLCSSNNNIARIEKMVGVLSSFGEYLGSVGGFHFHQFPTLERLSVISEQQLREAGFGYRPVQPVHTGPTYGQQRWRSSASCMLIKPPSPKDHMRKIFVENSRCFPKIDRNYLRSTSVSYQIGIRVVSDLFFGCFWRIPDIFKPNKDPGTFGGKKGDVEESARGPNQNIFVEGEGRHQQPGKWKNPKPIRLKKDQEVEILEGIEKMPPPGPIPREELGRGYGERREEVGKERRGVDLERRRAGSEREKDNYGQREAEFDWGGNSRCFPKVDRNYLRSTSVSYHITASLRQQLDLKPCEIIARIESKFDIKVTYNKTWDARSKAIDSVFKSLEESYCSLYRLLEIMQLEIPKINSSSLEVSSVVVPAS